VRIVNLRSLACSLAWSTFFPSQSGSYTNIKGPATARTNNEQSLVAHASARLLFETRHAPTGGATEKHSFALNIRCLRCRCLPVVLHECGMPVSLLHRSATKASSAFCGNDAGARASPPAISSAPVRHERIVAPTCGRVQTGTLCHDCGCG
jgi:hypothetical protein